MCQWLDCISLYHIISHYMTLYKNTPPLKSLATLVTLIRLFPNMFTAYNKRSSPLQRRACAASLSSVSIWTGDLRKIALAVSRWSVSPKFCRALRASIAVDSPDTSEIALPSFSQTLAAAGPQAPEWASTTIGTKAMPSLAQCVAVSKKEFLACS